MTFNIKQICSKISFHNFWFGFNNSFLKDMAKFDFSLQFIGGVRGRGRNVNISHFRKKHLSFRGVKFCAIFLKSFSEAKLHSSCILMHNIRMHILQKK